MRNPTLVALFSLLASTLLAQEEVFRINVERNNYVTSSGVPSGDSLLVTVRGASKSTYYWVSPHGGRQFSWPELNAFEIFAIGGNEDTTHYYFIKASGKKALVGAASEIHGVRSIRPANVEVKGRVYGSYVENGHLFVLVSEKSTHALKLVEYNGLNKVKETNFPLSIDLGRKKNASVVFFDNDKTVLPQMTSATTKVIKEGNAIWIVVDEPPPIYPDPDIPNPVVRTSLIRLDLMTGESSIKVFFCPGIRYFGSTYYAGKLYRLAFPSERELQIFDAYSGKQLSTLKETVREKGAPIPPFVVRDGDTGDLGISNNFSVGSESGPLLVVTPREGDGEHLLIGYHWEKEVRLFLFFPGVMGSAIFGPLLSTMLNSAANTPDVCAYQSYVIRDGQLEITNDVPTIPLRIDAFEMSFKSQPRAKRYYIASNYTYALYVDSRASAIQVVTFH